MLASWSQKNDFGISKGWIRATEEKVWRPYSRDEAGRSTRPFSPGDYRSRFRPVFALPDRKGKTLYPPPKKTGGGVCQTFAMASDNGHRAHANTHSLHAAYGGSSIRKGPPNSVMRFLRAFTVPRSRGALDHRASHSALTLTSFLERCCCFGGGSAFLPPLNEGESCSCPSPMPASPSRKTRNMRSGRTKSSARFPEVAYVAQRSRARNPRRPGWAQHDETIRCI